MIALLALLFCGYCKKICFLGLFRVEKVRKRIKSVKSVDKICGVTRKTLPLHHQNIAEWSSGSSLGS